MGTDWVRDRTYRPDLFDSVVPWTKENPFPPHKEEERTRKKDRTRYVQIPGFCPATPSTLGVLSTTLPFRSPLPIFPTTSRSLHPTPGRVGDDLGYD